MFDGSIIYLSPPRNLFDDPRTVQGLAGMVQWLLPEGSEERKRIVEIWNNQYQPLDPTLAVRLLSKDKRDRSLTAFTSVYEFTGGSFLTTPTATLRTQSNPAAEWEASLIHPRKGKDNYKGDWLYLSLKLNKLQMRNWTERTHFTAIERTTGREITEVLCPVVFPADGWDGRYHREYNGPEAPLVTMNRLHKETMAGLRDKESSIAHRLENAQFEPTVLRLSAEHAKSIKTQEAELRKVRKRIFDLGTEYHNLLKKISKAQHVLDRCVLDRGWKALMLAGMQVMELDIKTEES